MNHPQIQRFSSRTHPIDRTTLTKYLKQARCYHRIAGYFFAPATLTEQWQTELLDKLGLLRFRRQYCLSTTGVVSPLRYALSPPADGSLIFHR
jgi:hypothetical protein